MIYRKLAVERNWTPQQIERLTLRQLSIYLQDQKRFEQRKQSADMLKHAQTKAGKQRLEFFVKSAVDNLLEGRRWDARRRV